MYYGPVGLKSLQNYKKYWESQFSGPNIEVGIVSKLQESAGLISSPTCVSSWTRPILVGSALDKKLLIRNICWLPAPGLGMCVTRRCDWLMRRPGRRWQLGRFCPRSDGGGQRGGCAAECGIWWGIIWIIGELWAGRARHRHRGQPPR